MKAADVKIGGEYLTRVGDSLVRVRVTEAVIADLFRLSGPRMAYAVERLDGGRKLAPRSAARLRPAPDRVMVKASVERVSLSIKVES